MARTQGTERLSHPRKQLPALQLRVIEGPDAGATLTLTEGTYRVGKSEEAELRLNDGAVSRLHLVLKVLDGAVRVSDPSSRNGSFIDGVRFREVDAALNAKISIGRSVLQLLPLGSQATPAESFGRLWGKSAPMLSLFDTLGKVSRAAADVLIFGESGTGKELCAEAIHQHSARAKGAFVICDLAGVSTTLFESELFGHLKGAFTGATASRAGALERAGGGTVFLDEVGELPLELQPKLLRFLERRQLKAVGSDVYQTLDVRVVAATNRDLKAEVAAGRFREDLYHRLAVLTVRVPPLRERKDDLPGLVDRVLSQLGHAPSTVGAKTRALLEAHDWPGNVRELRNVVLQATHLGEPAAIATATTRASSGEPFHAAKDRLISAFELDYLKGLMLRAKGNVSKAARDSGLDRVHLHRLLKKHHLDAR